MKLISPKRYIDLSTEKINNAKVRVYVMSMIIADHDETHEFIKSLENAAKRGVNVVVAADVFTFGEISSGFLPLSYYSKASRETNGMVRMLKKAGVKFFWLGTGRTTTFQGRTHSKWCIVDDDVFSFGGVNLYDEGIQNIDYMFHLKNKKIADRLVNEQNRVVKADRKSINYPSIAYEYDNMKLLIDGGIIGQSIVFSRTIELATIAAHITFVSQYCPTGKLARILKKKNAKLYYNRPAQADGLNRLAIKFGELMTGLNTLYTGNRYLHAKCIIFTLKDGSKVAITGSHNFAGAGVLLGTREIALETSDLNTISQLEDFVKNEVVNN